MSLDVKHLVGVAELQSMPLLSTIEIDAGVNRFRIGQETGPGTDVSSTAREDPRHCHGAMRISDSIRQKGEAATVAAS